MARMQNPNLEILVLVVERLGALADEMVFLGGCATGLLITDPAAPPIRETRDVDAIVQVSTLVEYHRLSERLRQCGFREDASEGAPVCRWIAEGVILDVMPADQAILGFGNRWYVPAMEHTIEMALPSGRAIRMVSAPYFLLTKLEAFDGRGNDDYQASHDLEDVIAVLDGRPGIVEEVEQAERAPVEALRARFRALLRNPRFIDAVSGHLPTDAASQARVTLVIRKMEALAKGKME